MICQFAFSRAAFERLIAYRLMDRFQPLTTPIPGPSGEPSWLDGATVDGIHLTKLAADRWVALNEVDAGGLVVPSKLNQGFNAAAVRVGVHATVHFATVAAVAAAGTAAPATTSVTVPAFALGVFVRVDVTPQGVAVLRLEPDLSAAPPGLPPNIAGSLATTADIDVGAALAGLVPGGTRVLNAGMTLSDDDEILLRFEMTDENRKSLIERYQGWHQFFEGDPPSYLAGQAWAVAVDGPAVASAIGTRVGPYLKDEHPLYFTSAAGAEFRGGAPPRITVSKSARIDNACAGNDIRLDVFVHLDLSVPADNVLRGGLHFELDKNDWDVAKCFGLAIINPLGILITAFDHGATGIGAALTVADLLVPGLKPAGLLAGLAGLIAGVDEELAVNAVNDKLKDEPGLTRTPDGFALDRPIEFTNPLTLDWFVLTDVAAVGDRFVLRGRSDVPAPSLPRVNAHSLEGMSTWSLRDRCEPGRGQETTGSLALELAVGYRVNDGMPAPRRPTIPMRYGLRADLGAQVYEVVDDPLGVYQDPHSEYWPVKIPGVPGTMTVKLTDDTVRKDQFADFGPHPYPLRVRMFTNGGVREYTFAAPPPLTSYTESVAQAAARISRCKQLRVGLIEEAVWGVLWLVDPPDLRTFGRLWNIHVAGLDPRERVTVLAPDSDTVLADGVANAAGRTELRLVTSDAVDVVRLATAADHDDAAAPERKTVDVAVEQTLLSMVDHVEVPDGVDEMAIEAHGGELLVRIGAARQVASRLDVVPGGSTRTGTLAGAWKLARWVSSADTREAREGLRMHGHEVVDASDVVAVVADGQKAVTTFRKESNQIITGQWLRR